MLSIKIGLVKIPVMLVNLVNSRYAEVGLHQFSTCHHERIKMNKTCGKCGDTLTSVQILKGLDKDTILSEEQQTELKEVLDNGYIEVLSIKPIYENLANDLLPLAQDTKLILPSISKGFRKEDIKTFYSFFSALNDLNSYCVVKFIQRGLEHLGIFRIQNGELLYTEVSFKHYQNTQEVKRLKTAVSDCIRAENITNLESYKKEATEFLKGIDKEKNLNEIEEEKLVLLKKYVEEIRSGKMKNLVKKIKEEEIEVNPFSK